MENQPKKPKVKNKLKYILIILALLVAITGGFFLQNKPNNSDSITDNKQAEEENEPIITEQNISLTEALIDSSIFVINQNESESIFNISLIQNEDLREEVFYEFDTPVGIGSISYDSTHILFRKSTNFGRDTTNLQKLSLIDRSVSELESPFYSGPFETVGNYSPGGEYIHRFAASYVYGKLFVLNSLTEEVVYEGTTYASNIVWINDHQFVYTAGFNNAIGSDGEIVTRNHSSGVTSNGVIFVDLLNDIEEAIGYPDHLVDYFTDGLFYFNKENNILSFYRREYALKPTVGVYSADGEVLKLTQYNLSTKSLILDADTNNIFEPMIQDVLSKLEKDVSKIDKVIVDPNTDHPEWKLLRISMDDSRFDSIYLYNEKDIANTLKLISDEEDYYKSFVW